MSTPENPLRSRLAAPFDARTIRWKPQVVQGNRALAVAYVDARVVMDRLDSVLGVGNWQTSYRETKDGIVCQLRAKIDGEWCMHEDVGSESAQPDEGDRRKAAFSDAIKRAAVHLGIGRYLYRLEPQWVDYDPKKKQFTKAPVLPPWALPAAAPAQASAPAKNAPAARPVERPHDEDMDPAELIDAKMGQYLFQLALRLGWTEQQLEAANQDRFAARTGELTVAQWREAVALLEKMQQQDRQTRRAS